MVATEKSNRDYMLSFITRICKEVGPRRSASEEERKACGMIKEECEKYADEVKFDRFQTAYKAYPGGLVRVAFVLISIGMILMLTSIYWLQIAVSLLALWVVVAELMVILEFTDPFYKKDDSYNVFGVIKPQKEAKVKVIFGGHSDSAYEMPFAKKYGVKISNLMFGAIGYGFAGVIFSIIKLILDAQGRDIDVFTWGSIIRITSVDVVYLIISIVGYPFLCWVVWNAGNRGTVVMGANDNLTGVAVSLALGKYFRENRLDNVEVWFGSFGSEEAGQRGSKRFVQKYGLESHELDNSYTVVLESLSGMGFGILTAEKMYLHWPSLKPVYHSKELFEKYYASVKRYIKERKPVPFVKVHEATFAGTDATRFSQQGFKAIALATGGSNLFIDHWHDRSDTPENINKLMLWHALNMCATFVTDLDKELAGAENQNPPPTNL